MKRNGNSNFFFPRFFLHVPLPVSERANYKEIFTEVSHNVFSIDAMIVAMFYKINKIFFGYDGFLGRQFCLDFLFQLLIPRRMPGAYAWFVVFRSQQFLSKSYWRFPKKNIFKYNQLQPTWYNFHYLPEIKSQQDRSYHKTADKTFVYLS